MADAQLITASRYEQGIKSLTMPSVCFNLPPQTASNEGPAAVIWGR